MRAVRKALKPHFVIPSRESGSKGPQSSLCHSDVRAVRKALKPHFVIPRSESDEESALFQDHSGLLIALLGMATAALLFLLRRRFHVFQDLIQISAREITSA